MWVLNWEGCAWGGIWFLCFQGVEFEEAANASPVFHRVRERIAHADRLCASGLSQACYGRLVALIFKQPVPPHAVAGLQKAGFDFRKLTRDERSRGMCDEAGENREIKKRWDMSVLCLVRHSLRDGGKPETWSKEFTTLLRRGFSGQAKCTKITKDAREVCEWLRVRLRLGIRLRIRMRTNRCTKIEKRCF